jgi:hypothetical protein
MRNIGLFLFRATEAEEDGRRKVQGGLGLDRRWRLASPKAGGRQNTSEGGKEKERERAGLDEGVREGWCACVRVSTKPKKPDGWRKREREIEKERRKHHIMSE